MSSEREWLPAEQLLSLLRSQADQLRLQAEQITSLTAQIGVLTEQVAELDRRLRRNSSNSSLPPSPPPLQVLIEAISAAITESDLDPRSDSEEDVIEVSVEAVRHLLDKSKATRGITPDGWSELAAAMVDYLGKYRSELGDRLLLSRLYSDEVRIDSIKFSAEDLGTAAYLWICDQTSARN